MFKLKRGDTARDLVTGFTGIVTTRADHLAGCNRYWLQPKIAEDGKLPEGGWFDEPALEQLDVLRVTLDQPVDPPG
jgi:hypothetical protein